MQVSIVGLVVCALLLGVGRLLGNALIIGLITAIAFGSTAAMTLTALGGSSPLISVVFSALLVAAVLLRRTAAEDLGLVFAGQWVAWVAMGLAAYAAAGAIVLPRLFAGATSAFVTSRDTGVVEVALAPTSGNITQTGYFVLGSLTFVALSAWLAGDRREWRGPTAAAPLPPALAALKTGLFLWVGVNVASGAIDLAAKTVGAGDVLMPIRTATFAFLTEVEQAGFARISGTYSEASAFGGASLAGLAFTYTYWRRTGSTFAMVLAGASLTLLILSTSSTAYVGLIVMALPVLLSTLRAFLTLEASRQDVVVMFALAIGAAVLLILILANPSSLEPAQKLIQTTLIDKSQSESGRERSYWNERSLGSVLDTWGLGIGFGSSRTSNWVVAVLSQLGVIGALLEMALLMPLWKRLAVLPGLAAAPVAALHDSLCACALAVVLASTIAGGSADPGLLFFVLLAGATACRALAKGASSPAPRVWRRQTPIFSGVS